MRNIEELKGSRSEEREPFQVAAAGAFAIGLEYTSSVVDISRTPDTVTAFPLAAVYKTTFAIVPPARTGSREINFSVSNFYRHLLSI